MTQLTFNQKSRRASTEDDEGEEKETIPQHLPASDVEAWMARIRRNSGCGRRRQASEQSEPGSHRTRRRLPIHGIRELADDNTVTQLNTHTDATTANPALSNAYSRYNTGDDFARQGNSNFSLAKLTGSASQVALSPDSFSSSAYVVETQDTLSPLVFTPTHSTVSHEHVASQDDYMGYGDSLEVGVRGPNSLFEKRSNHGEFRRSLG